MANRSSAAPVAAAPVAVVTGANRGLGLEVCRRLAGQGWQVVLCARDAAQAAAAATSIDPATVRAERLDVTDPASVAAFAERLRARARGVPIAALVNNAGISLSGFDAEVVRGTLAVNYRGAARVTEALLPLLAPRAAVVMVSSGMGELSGLGAALRRRMLDETLDRSGLEALLAEFEAAAEAGDVTGDLAGAGWPRSAYSVSKAALNTLTRILAREWGPQGPRVNAVCPGWVRTAMGGASASRSVAAGAKGIVWAATLGPDGPTGRFFRDGKAIDW